MMFKKETQVYYSPDSQLKNPKQLMKNMLMDLGASQELAYRLFIRNISAQYRKTYLGYVWAFLPPILTTAIFVFLNKNKIFEIESTPIPYPIFVLAGSILWQLFYDSLQSPIRLVNTSREMLAKINFPREALILAGIYEVLFNFLIRFSLFLAAMFYFKLPLSLGIFWVPFGIAAIVILGITLGLFLTPLSVLYQDAEQGIPLVMSLWFFMTPVVYPLPQTGAPSLLAKINPISPLLTTTREWMTGMAVSQIHVFGAVALIFLCIFISAWFFYRLALPHIIARIGS